MRKLNPGFPTEKGCSNDLTTTSMSQQILSMCN